MKTQLLITFILILGCSNQNKNEEQKKVIERKEIVGIWTKNQKNASISFEKDSVLYIESLSRYKYSIKEDTLIIYFDGFDSRSKIITSKDTLKLINEQGESKYFRFKKN